MFQDSILINVTIDCWLKDVGGRGEEACFLPSQKDIKMFENSWKSSNQNLLLIFANSVFHHVDFIVLPLT